MSRHVKGSTVQKLEIARVLFVSTAHLTPNERLDLVETVGQHPHREGYGAIWWIGDDEVGHDVSDWSDGCQQIVKIARQNECTYVAFDADADTVAGVPTYED